MGVRHVRPVFEGTDLQVIVGVGHVRPVFEGVTVGGLGVVHTALVVVDVGQIPPGCQQRAQTHAVITCTQLQQAKNWEILGKLIHPIMICILSME